LLSKGYYLNRTCFEEAKNLLNSAVSQVITSQKAQIVVIAGKRASGKSVLAKQLLSNAYFNLQMPSIVLTPNASYVEVTGDSDKEINISGWDARIVDKFLSQFYSGTDVKQSDVVPVILADHLINRVTALNYLLTYLKNHNKPCVLLLTLNEDEFEKLKQPEDGERLLQLYDIHEMSIPHQLDDQEIDDLFKVVSRLEPKVRDNKNELIPKAKYTSWGKRDILIILYTWFDNKFRRFDEIIAEEIEKLQLSEAVKSFYLAVSAFHQYNYSPPLSICAKASNISLDEFSTIRSSPLFKSMINIDRVITKPRREVVSTRHSMFSKIVLQRLMPDNNEKINLMCRVLSLCDKSESNFVRDFFIHICRYESSLNVEQVTKIKDATEINLSNDYLINHQFGAYLIREGVNFDDARYYLDLANAESPFNSSILHSIGNLYYKQFKAELNKDKEKSLEYYNFAQKYFSLCREQVNNHEEYAYYTEISMMHHRLNNFSEDKDTKAILNAEKNALIHEALSVVPSERQNLLKDSLNDVPFNDLDSSEQEKISSVIMAGKASYVLLEYYSDSLIQYPSSNNWNKLNELVSIYWELSKDDIHVAIVLYGIVKNTFIKNASTRFELMRTYYNDLIRYQNTKINFSLLARYVRLLQVDALALEKYDFLRNTAEDIVNLFRDSKPSFLKDEYVLKKEYYCFDENNSEKQIEMFITTNKNHLMNARRYQTLVNLHFRDANKRFFTIELDPISHYYVKGVRKEVAAKGRVDLSFAIKYRYDGFWATDFRI
jgi:GTPase SAR1 family protein